MGNIGRNGGGLCRAAFLITCVCWVAASRDAGASENIAETGPFRVRMKNEAAQAVARTLAEADRLLAEPACQQVLTDFSDASARPLKEVLDGNEVSARAYLRWIVFSDGRGMKGCNGRAALAVTEPGSRVVFICPTAFMEMASGDPDYASAALIHEMFHTLGLGENPPRSRDITDRVRARCLTQKSRATEARTSAPPP